jgi:ABC-type uncharacterized transport system ATPase subunit
MSTDPTPLMKPLEPATLRPVVTFENVTKSFGSFTAIKNVSFRVDDHPGRGEFV